jgi:hypothetical protein
MAQPMQGSLPTSTRRNDLRVQGAYRVRTASHWSAFATHVTDDQPNGLPLLTFPGRRQQTTGRLIPTGTFTSAANLISPARPLFPDTSPTLHVLIGRLSVEESVLLAMDAPGVTRLRETSEDQWHCRPRLTVPTSRA